MNKGFWMAKGPGVLGHGGEMAYDNSSRVEPKRSQLWFRDGTEAELFPSKKQVVEIPSHNSFSELLDSNSSPWENSSSFQSVPSQFTERLFDPEMERPINFDNRKTPAVDINSMNVGRKVIEDPFGSDSSFGLSMSHSMEDPKLGLNYGGIRKVKVSQVKDYENFMSVSMGHTYAIGDNNTMPTSDAYSKAGDTSITMGLSFNRGGENMISLSDPFNRAYNNFVLMGQSYYKGDNNDISKAKEYKENSSAIAMGQYLVKNESNAMTICQTFSEVDQNTISTSHIFKQNNDVVSVGQPLNNCDTSITSMVQTFNEESDNTVPIGHTYNKVDDSTMSLGCVGNKIDNSSFSMGHSFSKGESTIISFGGLNDENDVNPSGRHVCSYDLLERSSFQSSEEAKEKGLAESNADALASDTQIIAPGGPFSKKREDQKSNKKGPPNNFPSNVRSLLSTGMLDGVPVKYIAWSREKELRGIIKGSGYLCGCQSCNFSKAINAYELERHANCKTKHPNNHIYFENGKTVYGIVQELRNTPQGLLFEVIQTITGSPINQKSFRLWKESFLAATRELQRIYGKEEGQQLS